MVQQGQGGCCVEKELARFLLLDVGLGLRNFSFGSRRFMFERWPGNVFVGCARLVFLFRVGLAQLFLEVALLGHPVGPSRYLPERRKRKFLYLARAVDCFISRCACAAFCWS